MEDHNILFPIFLKPNSLQMLIVGGGGIAYEKLDFLFRHSGGMLIKVVAETFNNNIVQLANKYTEVQLIQKSFDKTDLLDINLILIATNNNHKVNKEICAEAKKKGIFVNVADTPELCDFYLSSVIKKGDLKIAISSNGKSPTLTKRIREMLEDVLPNNVNELLQNLQEIRNSLKGDFEYKVKELNRITSVFKQKKK